MPYLKTAESTIYYETRGSGYPLMLLAPGGMRSVVEMWGPVPGDPASQRPWIDPREELCGDYLVVSMDQRNAGRSEAPVRAGDGWHSYASDQLALADHLGLRRTHLMGGCIGSSFCLGFIAADPGRVGAAILQNPIGLSADNRADFYAMFDDWASELRRSRPEVRAEDLAALREQMFGGDFVFSVGRDFVAACEVPLLVLAGNDRFHPTAIAEEIADLAPHAELVKEWAGPERKAATAALIRQWLAAHTPAGAA